MLMLVFRHKITATHLSFTFGNNTIITIRLLTGEGRNLSTRVLLELPGALLDAMGDPTLSCEHRRLGRHVYCTHAHTHLPF